MEDYRVTQTGDEIQEILNQSPIDTADIVELKEAATLIDGRLESVEVKIPAGASEENPLTDKQYVDDSIASASATFRGTYNEVTDLELTTEATHADIGSALDEVIELADSNDYCFVQIPTADATPTEIESIERYKFVTGTGWQYEYTLNNSGFTADQWAAINSGITSGLVVKLTDLPTNAELNTLLNGKANAADVYTKSETYTKIEIDTQLGAKANSADVYPKTDTYTKQEVDALITTPEVQYVTVTATSGTTSVTDVLPATGAANTIYRVGSWDGTQYATGVYSEYAWNGTTYILLDVKNYGFATGSDFDNPTTAQRELVTTVGSVLDGISEGVFDLTAKTGDSYATLADALTAANTAIPTNKKKGGMSIKFVQSSDNKYVQYLLTEDKWSSNVWDWEKTNLEKEQISLLVKLKGFGTSGSETGATQVGDVYFNTNSNTLQRKYRTTGSPTYETLPFYNGAIYQYNNDLYTWDGNKMLVHKRVSISTMVLSNNNASIQIPEIGQECNLTPEGSSYLHYGVFNVSDDSILLIHSGLGGQGARLWGWLNADNKVLERAESGESATDKIIFAPSGAVKLVINSTSVWSGDLFDDDISNVIHEVEREIKDIKSDLIEIPLSLDAKAISCNQGVGNYCEATPQASSSGFHYALIDCSEGDKFIINGSGASSARLWCFLDSNNIILLVADVNLTLTNEEIIAPKNAAKLIINSNDGGINYKKTNNGIIHNIEELSDSINMASLRLSVTENLNGISDNVRKTMCLCGLKTAITNNSMPYTDILLWHEYPNAQNNKLYYSNSINGGIKEFGSLTNWDPANSLFAISPKDGRIISTKKDIRRGICIFDGTTTTIINSINGKIPSGWLYNSGVDFINDGDDEYCVFAEYGWYDTFYVWRGKYPYTSESDWETVMTKRGQAGDNPEITHFHTIRRDPWTDILYCTSGDYQGMLFWWYSTDKGATWTQLTDGTIWEAQCARNIGFIFTEDYAYWATDNGNNHSFNRIKRNSITGVLNISTREKLASLPYGQATNSICYVESLNGIFFYERLDSTFQNSTAGYYTLFYSFDSKKLYKVSYYTLNQSDYEASGKTGKAWGGHRGKCYINYANAQIKYPAMGFAPDTPCIIDMIGEDNMNIGTIYYD